MCEYTGAAGAIRVVGLMNSFDGFDMIISVLRPRRQVEYLLAHGQLPFTCCQDGLPISSNPPKHDDRTIRPTCRRSLIESDLDCANQASPGPGGRGAEWYA